jgi:hypothetical protein
MNSWLGALMTAVVLAMAVPGHAQAPMSPIFPTLPSKSAQPPASKAISVAPAAGVTKPAPAVARSEPDDPAVATAVIPPPLPDPPAAKAEPQKRATAQTGAESAAAQRRADRRSRYARRRFAPYYAYPSYGYATATVSGWGGGRFGPTPYSTSGQ